MVPERVVKQYLAYCEDSGFKAPSRSTLLRILAVCPASTHKSLQGLDYVTSAGAQAFDDLAHVVEKLGDAGKGMGWAKDMQTRLQCAKRYLKTDYKIQNECKDEFTPTKCRNNVFLHKMHVASSRVAWQLHDRRPVNLFARSTRHRKTKYDK
ncbi:hypothetical protein AC249_AIPGENE3679 [Exaiptasia diaphana]|nr:hypothetical protein AC249_AIPGENE3679 [Exaiptasia diaphana]